ncbi:GNAT family N-acetyltransferase [bacterium]|nr:GNAT family N-acetyltransferase [bacterium]
MDRTEIDIAIVPATSEAHFSFIAQHFEETIALWEDYQVSSKSVQGRKDQLKKWIADDKVHLTVAVCKDEDVVGFNSLFITNDYSGNAYGKIVILYVLPEHRGKMIAASLKREGESWLKSRGITKVVTEIDAKNRRMLEISEKAGFQIKSYTFEKQIADSQNV